MTAACDLNQSCPLLRLPPSIRHCIYLYTGFVPLHDDYNLHSVLKLNGHPACPALSGVHGLLLSCRAVYNEVCVLFYSANRFIIRYHGPGGLEPLRNLTPLALSSLANLKIVLNQTSCHAERACESFAGREVKYDHELQDRDDQVRDTSLSGHREDLTSILTEWNLAVAYLSSRIRPSALELSVVCDVLHKDIETARRVVEPLGRLPALKNCHLRLSQIPTANLNTLARDAVLQARQINIGFERPGVESSSLTSSPPQTIGSRLLALPRELRFRILEYTDLVTPWKEVTWGREPRGYVASQSFCYPLDFRGEECPPRIHNGCQFLNCWETYPEPSIGCFCRVYHSAFSSTCKCWTPPDYLFRICRTLRNDAKVVFFSQNRFVIHDYRASLPSAVGPGRYAQRRCAASQFLASVVPEDCLGELRFLEFVFPPYAPDQWPQRGDVAAELWVDTLDRVRGKLNLPALTIRLVMSPPSEWDIPSHRSHMTEEEGKEILAGYVLLLEPLARFGADGLARFYASIEWPWAWTTESTDRTLVEGSGWIEAKRRWLKGRFERAVLQERYDHQSASESGEPHDSLWVRRFARDA